MHTVADILKKKGPNFNTISADAKVIDALGLMKSENHSYLVVLSGNDYAGIFTERDYAQKVDLLGKDAEHCFIKEVMTADLPNVSSDKTINECMLTMDSYKTKYLPVFDEFEFKGVISISDLVHDSLKEEPPATP